MAAYRSWRCARAFVSTLGICLLVLTTGGNAMAAAQASTIGLQNESVGLTLGLTPQGAPRLVSCRWTASGETVFEDVEPEAGVEAWVPASLRGEPARVGGWRRADDAVFLRAEAECALPHGLEMTWVVELDRESALMRLGARASNGGNEPVAVEWFPAWNGSWTMPGGADALRYWEPLTFAPRQAALGTETITLGSRLHSSDSIENGKNAYWAVTGSGTRMYFGLDWCGGWRAELGGIDGGFRFRVYLPHEETQLTLAPGERITGPAIMVTPVSSMDDATGRAEWMKRRASLAARLYGGPAPSFPFAWNHWYTVRFAVDEDFLTRQVEAMDPYGFDYFVVDAGWYAACGDWTPHPEKFAPGAFEGLLGRVHEKDVRVGIWTCPQFVGPNVEVPGLRIDDRPGFHRRFIDGMLVDMNGSAFDDYLVRHVGALREDYRADWWKYDQDFFVAETRAGQMKNVVALQKALAAVRAAYPDLYIESCQSGGRMLNEFTVLSSQTQWIRDGGHTGLAHARSNFLEAIQALEFLPPWAALRWINRPDESDQDDDEFTRMYCRSAMAGAWGLVADLSLIGERQRNVIVQEVDRYRRFSALKHDCLYDIHRPSAGSPAAGIVFYTADRRRAGLLFLRWDAVGAFEVPVALDRLHADGDYRVEFVDSGETRAVTGAALRESGLALSFGESGMSQLVFVEAAE